MRRHLALIPAVLLATLAATAWAGAPCCNSCGCQPCTRKVCRLICEEKEEIKKTYDCKCEDFCIPGPSKCCKVPCNDCDCRGCGNWFGLCCHKKEIWKPTCGCVRTRTVLVINEEKKKVPHYKCVVEEVCCRCGHCSNKIEYPAAGDAETAIAMVQNAGVDRVIAPSGEIAINADPAAATAATINAQPIETAAKPSFYDRLFTRK